MKDFLLEAPPASPFGTHVSPAGFLPDGGIAAGNRQGHVSPEPARRGLLLAEPRLGTPRYTWPPGRLMTCVSNGTASDAAAFRKGW